MYVLKNRQIPLNEFYKWEINLPSRVPENLAFSGFFEMFPTIIKTIYNALDGNNKSTEKLKNLIKECYGSNVEYDKVDHLVKDETFNDLLCVFLYNDKVFNLENMINLRKNNLGKERNYKPIGMVIAQFDQKTKEASIEYLCVSEKFRNKGLGSILLQEILLRISNIADF